MKIVERNHESYRLPGGLSDFQQELYIHLIDWKWQHLTREPGIYRGKPYDALLPDAVREQLLLLHPSIVDAFITHQKNFPFKKHKFISHMASSQAACANLFLPILQYPVEAACVLQAVKSDLQAIAVDWLDHGYQLEFWDKPDNALKDHNPVSGTDADIAIAYYSKTGDLNLWLIEHKLTEQEFTTCGGYRSPNRNPDQHRCDSISAILANKRSCYYDSASGYRYWDITFANEHIFPRERLLEFATCPFQGGLNQLWRNQLLGLAIENSSSEKWPFKKVYFSVVHHPQNHALDGSLNLYRKLIGSSDRFFSFTSDVLIRQAKQLGFSPWDEWLTWFEELYYLPEGESV
jgi:hypothetical protein